jgi:PhoPQ-activated pathogenicity-related protein
MQPVSCSLLALAAASVGLAPGAAHADLDVFLRKPEPAYRWEKRGEQEIDGCRVYDLHLVSQVWQGITWEHRLRIFRPEKLEHPEFCTLYNTGGSGSDANTQQGIRLAKGSGAVYAILYNIPNQPLYGGKTEDALVVYTWLKFMETGDESWPLHFPMAKAVLKAMDAIQAFTRESGFPPITGFLIHGASKRGWTTWLAGASRDPRIKAIAPMVIDVLNVRKQGPHQVEAYGKLSEQVGDYSSAGIPQKLETPEGRRLMELEDPYSYRDRLTLPKLLILGTNDRYWSQDALNLYWDDLKGPKWVLYDPNSGHGLEDRERVYATLSAFIRMIAGHGRWPKMRWSYTQEPGGAALTLHSDIAPRAARLFHVQAPTKDFRDNHWTFEPMQKADGGFTARWPAPAEGYAAIFGEVVYDLDGQPFTLSTQIRILGGKR